MSSNVNLGTIMAAFRSHNIHLQHEQLLEHPMLNNITNTFKQATDNDGNTYLIRINGKLWPPYTRASESDNLEQLRQKRIKTNVIHNDKEFQICILKPEEKRFSMITDQNMKMECLKKVAGNIKNYQTAVEFQNTLSIRDDLVVKSFDRLSKDKKEKLNFYYEIIMKIIFVIEHDRKDKVSSHNDLLPSDIYYIDGEVIIVDWEYSARNHPYYDLAHLSVYSSLTLEQDQAFLTTYDKSIKNFSIGHGHSFILMKAIVSFLLLMWNNKPEKDEQLTTKFLVNLQDVFGYALHENSMVSELASLILSETVVIDLLKSFAFRSSVISSSMNPSLFESIQIIMNNGHSDLEEVSALHDKFRSVIKTKYPESDYSVQEKHSKEDYEKIFIPLLSEICSIKFYVYKKINCSVESEPLQFGNNTPYLQLCAYLIFHEDTEHYEPICLFNTKDDKIVKTKFLINSPTHHLLENFVRDTNALDCQIARQASEEKLLGNDVTPDTTAIVIDQRKIKLLSYINQFRNLRQKHQLFVSNVQINDDVVDHEKSEEEIHRVLQNEMDFIFSIAQRATPEEITLVEDESNAGPVTKQIGGKERIVGASITISKGSAIKSDTLTNTDANTPSVIAKNPITPNCSSTLTQDTQSKTNQKRAHSA